jgi:hypothetical protein
MTVGELREAPRGEPDDTASDAQASLAAKAIAECLGVMLDTPKPALAPSTVDVSTIKEYGLTQKLSAPIRCF